MAEILQIVIWPAVVLIVAVAAMLIFKETIVDLLNRLRRVGVAGVSLDVNAAVTAASTQSESKPAESGLAIKSAPEVKAEKRLQQLRDIDVSPIVQEQQQLIRADLQGLGVAEEEQVELLIKHLAVTTLLYRAEFTYRTIFGSQIALLKFLNEFGVGTREQLSQFYEDAKARFPQSFANYSFERYLWYLVNQGLIKTEDQQHYGITVGGQEFLKWMISVSASQNKIL